MVTGSLPNQSWPLTKQCADRKKEDKGRRNGTATRKGVLRGLLYIGASTRPRKITSLLIGDAMDFREDPHMVPSTTVLGFHDLLTISPALRGPLIITLPVDRYLDALSV